MRNNQSERVEISALIAEFEQVRRLGGWCGEVESEKSSESTTGAVAAPQRIGGELSNGMVPSPAVPASRPTPSSSSSSNPRILIAPVSGEAVSTGGDVVVVSREKLTVMLRLAEETLQRQTQILEEVHTIEQRWS